MLNLIIWGIGLLVIIFVIGSILAIIGTGAIFIIKILIKLTLYLFIFKSFIETIKFIRSLFKSKK